VDSDGVARRGANERPAVRGITVTSELTCTHS